MSDADGGREPFAHYLDRMRALGFRPSRRLGQNFLLDPSLHRALVDAAEVNAHDGVLEVGAGLGFLTRELASRAGHVIAVEIDDRLARILREELQSLGAVRERVDLLEADALCRGHLNPLLVDALQAQRRALGDAGRQLLVANLPYAVSGPLLAELVGLRAPLHGGAVMVQLELAQRVCAEPDTAAYGSLSVLLQSLYELHIVRRVGAAVFRPRPRVDSAVFAFRQRADAPLLGAEDRGGFARFLRQLFSQRRKKMRNALPGACRAAGVAQPALEPVLLGRRPSELDPDGLAAIWRAAPRLP